MKTMLLTTTAALLWGSLERLPRRRDRTGFPTRRIDPHQANRAAHARALSARPRQERLNHPVAA